MRDFGSALGLMLAIEGLVMAGFTETDAQAHGGDVARRGAAAALGRYRRGGVRRRRRLGGADAVGL